jgi:hypothetical protein
MEGYENEKEKIFPDKNIVSCEFSYPESHPRESFRSFGNGRE